MSTVSARASWTFVLFESSPKNETKWDSVRLISTNLALSHSRFSTRSPGSRGTPSMDNKNRKSCRKKVPGTRVHRTASGRAPSPRSRATAPRDSPTPLASSRHSEWIPQTIGPSSKSARCPRIPKPLQRTTNNMRRSSGFGTFGRCAILRNDSGSQRLQR